MDTKGHQSDLSLARKAWQVLEPYNAMIYFAPEAQQAFKAIGLKGYWMGYFASRSAALGPASASVVTALFYSFHSRKVARALPDAWRFASPEQVLAARYAAVDSALRRMLGAQVSSAEVAEAAELAREAVAGCSVIGRALFAAHCDLAWPEEPHLVLWHAATLLREYRGDGHIAALLAAGLDGCEAHLIQIARGSTTRELLQPGRGWSDEDWEAATQRLLWRNLLDNDGHLTAKGLALYEEVEANTDALASPPWQHIGTERTERLLDLVRPLSQRILNTEGAFPVPNPIGISPS